MKVFISGQKYFGEEILRLCLSIEKIKVVGVCCPIGDKYIGKLAAIHEIPIIPSGLLTAENFPHGVDVGITAHSFDYIGKKTRYRPRYGWIGYHPSLLPRHRGRSSIEWAIKMRDPLTGGTTFWLDSGIDRGDIILQEFVFLDPKLFSMDIKKATRKIWEDELCPLGVKLIRETLYNFLSGVFPRKSQDNRFSTWEPSTEVKDIYRPDALMLPEHKEGGNTW